MFNYLLIVKSSGIFSKIEELLGFLLNSIYNVLFKTFHIQSLGVSIIVFTVIIRFLLIPLAIKQHKSMKAMQKIQPELKKIQEKYKNKKDANSQKAQQQELAELYKKHNASPVGGCLPALIQLPIMFSLFRVLRNIPTYIASVKVIYMGIVNQITSIKGYEKILDVVAKSTKKRIQGYENQDIINFLSQFSSDNWNELIKNFASISDNINAHISKLDKFNYFFGLDISEAPGLAFPGIIIPILAVVLQILATRTMNTANNTTQDKTAAQTQKTMMYFFPLFTGVMVVSMPVGLGIYWITQSIVQVFQQIFINRYFNDDKEGKKA